MTSLFSRVVSLWSLSARVRSVSALSPPSAFRLSTIVTGSDTKLRPVFLLRPICLVRGPGYLKLFKASVLVLYWCIASGLTERAVKGTILTGKSKRLINQGRSCRVTIGRAVYPKRIDCSWVQIGRLKTSRQGTTKTTG
uniref:Secreted protein n=1 Tax=Utricularia reniformis TaxID=192314 RepID=A0A1Y0B4I4_9LAMI|nr:hypothetical protein AEK19_MT2144 [Utricularia reniformis]ART32294.1 hypothetical protein AEK19_MT2144 [Utricularia reniformis]